MKKIKFKSFLKGKIVDLVIIDEEFINNTDWFSWFNNEKSTKCNTLAKQNNESLGKAGKGDSVSWILQIPVTVFG